MDKIWDRRSFKVGGHWPLWRGWKNEWPRRTDKSWTLKKPKKLFLLSRFFGFFLSTLEMTLHDKSLQHCISQIFQECSIYQHQQLLVWFRQLFKTASHLLRDRTDRQPILDPVMLLGCTVCIVLNIPLIPCCMPLDSIS